MIKKLLLKILKNKKLWVMFLIVMSYIASYIAPIFILYMYTRDKFIKDVIIGERYSLSFIGFIIVSSVFVISLVIKLSIKFIKAKPSIAKYLYFTSVWFGFIIVVVYVLLKTYNFTYYVEGNAIAFFTGFRAGLETIKNGLYIFAICITASTIFKISALMIDKEYVHKLNWL